MTPLVIMSCVVVAILGLMTLVDICLLMRRKRLERDFLERIKTVSTAVRDAENKILERVATHCEQRAEKLYRSYMEKNDNDEGLFHWSLGYTEAAMFAGSLKHKDVE